MRSIPTDVPNFDTLNLPSRCAEGGRGTAAGSCWSPVPPGQVNLRLWRRSSTRSTRSKACHIVTVEDPIEFLHNHKSATIHQRELHSDTPRFALALRAALRQAPKVILVGEMRDRKPSRSALEAAETGHLVFSTLHTIDASKTIERIIGVFPLADQQAIRARVCKSLPLHHFAAPAALEGRPPAA